MNLGSTAISTLKLGSSAVSKMMLGSGMVWSSGITPTLYVDSVNGLDTNDGLTAGTALKTLAAARSALVAGDVVGLARGSFWREMMELRTVANVAFVPYGTGDIPEISGADIIAPNLFTASSHADAGGVTYEYAWTRGAGYEAGTDQVMLWEDDVRLYRRASVALVAANPGSYYAPGEEAATSTVYVHPYASTDPRSDGKSYEVTIRGECIDNSEVTASGGLVSGVHLKRAWSHTGPMTGPWRGTAPEASKLLIGGGGIHHIVTAASEVEDLLLYDVQKNLGTSFFPYTAYYYNGLGLTHKANRVFSFGDPTADSTSKAFNLGMYSHGGTNGFDVVTFNQCAVTDSAIGFGSSNPLIEVKGCYASGVSNVVNTGLGASNLVKHLFARSCGKGVSDAGPVDNASKTRLIENCVIEGTLTDNAIYAINRNGTLTIRNCVILGRSTKVFQVAATTGLTIIVENCIIIRDAAGAMVYEVKKGAGSYTGTNNLFLNTTATFENNNFYFHDGTAERNGITAWKAAGYDLNSVAKGKWNGFDALTDLFVEDPRTNGNYTLRTDTGIVFGDGKAITTAGPQEHWDWNQRKAVAGPPTAFPTLPATIADMKAYVADPTAWDFYP